MAIDAELQKQLDAARMAMFHHWATSEQAVGFRNHVNNLAPRMIEQGKANRAAQAKEVRSAEDSLDAWLADLLKASAHTEAGGYFYRSTDRQAFSDDPDCKVSARNFENWAKRLSSAGLIDHQLGFQRHGDMDGSYIERRRAGRYRATQSLLDIAVDYGICAERLSDHYKKPASPALSRKDDVTVKSAKDKRRLTPPPSAKLSEIKDQILRINEGLRQHEFNLESHPVVRRAFSRGDIPGFDYNHEGRLYAEYQLLSPQERSQLTIDDEATVEIDIRSCHLTILYALNNQPLPDGDLYDVEGIPRTLVKAAITKMMGNGHPKFERWSKDVIEKFRSGELLGQPLGDGERRRLYPTDEVIKRIVKARPVLNRLQPIECDWGKLQLLESEVIIATMLELLERGGFGVLSVHDSIIVPKKVQSLAMAALSRHFTEIVGVPPKLEVK